MPGTPISLDEAVDLTRTGDLWLFRGRSVADRAIQMTTNSPVNHVGMAVVIEDLPPLMWHAELGRSLPDMWSGGHQRGVQLHDLRSAVVVWANRYGQRAWLRQMERPGPTGTDHGVTREMEDALLRTVARLDGTPYPSTSQLAWRWLSGRVPDTTALRTRVTAPLRSATALRTRVTAPLKSGGASLWRSRRAPDGPSPDAARQAVDTRLENAYCAEVVAMTYQAMGLLPGGRRPQWFDPGRFWSGDDLALGSGFRLGAEIAVRVPAAPAGRPGRRAPQTDPPPPEA